MAEERKSKIDGYLIEATSARNISNAIDKCVDMFDVSRSTVHRWRRSDKIVDAVSIARILLAIAKARRRRTPPEPIPTLKDIVIICGITDPVNNQ